MAQYFSHLNGLTLGNNWGDLIRLLDKALVTGVDLPSLVTVTQETEENIRLQFVANHNTMLFQLVELVGFLPEKYNSAFRVIGVPSPTELILRVGTVVASDLPTVRGTAKIQSLGYEIIFRDAGDVKRVYRAKNPTAQHPFIRVDESTSSPDGTTGVYTSTYAKYAMVGLLEHMEHIDDFENPEVLQLPFDPADPAKNWKITDTGSNVIRGWGRWYWATDYWYWLTESNPVPNGNRPFSLVGDSDAFYLPIQPTFGRDAGHRPVYGCGLFNVSKVNPLIPNWFLSASFRLSRASVSYQAGAYSEPFSKLSNTAYFLTPRNDPSNSLVASVDTFVVNPSYGSSGMNSGVSNTINGLVPAMELPILDTGYHLRGTLKHLFHAGRKMSEMVTTPILSDTSMYIWDVSISYPSIGGFFYYLGELE